MLVRRKHWLVLSLSCSVVLLFLVMGGTPLYEAPSLQLRRPLLASDASGGSRPASSDMLSSSNELRNTNNLTSIYDLAIRNKLENRDKIMGSNVSDVSRETSRSVISSSLFTPSSKLKSNNRRIAESGDAKSTDNNLRRSDSSLYSGEILTNKVFSLDEGEINSIGGTGKVFKSSNNKSQYNILSDQIPILEQPENQLVKLIGKESNLVNQEHASSINLKPKSSTGSLMELTITDLDHPPLEEATPIAIPSKKGKIKKKPVKSNPHALKNLYSPPKSSRTYQQIFTTGVNAARYRVSREYNKFPGDIDFKPGSIVAKTSVKRILILTTWRSGSTFLGDIFNAYPGTFYSFEPLHNLLQKQHFQDGPLKPKVMGHLKNIMNCQMGPEETNYFEYVKNNTFLFSHNWRYWQSCSINRAICFDYKYYNQVCSLMPVNVMKTVRLGGQPVEDLLSDTALDLRVVHLVRDPRGTMHSRLKLNWCRAPVCSDPEVVCNDLLDDLGHAYRLQAKYPDRFLLVRYEDLGTRPEEMVQHILEFVGLTVTNSVKNFVKEHTKLNMKKNAEMAAGHKSHGIGAGRRRKPVGAYSTFRNSRSTTFAWRNNFNFTTVSKIQNACIKPIKLLNLRIFESDEEFRNESLPILLPEN